MRCVVVIPVGPGHETLVDRAWESVGAAWRYREKWQPQSPFTELDVVCVDDTRGALGRGAARNEGLDRFPADWHFLLDADDEMMPKAFGMLEPSVAATFGAIMLDGKPLPRDLHPVTRETLFERGARGTLTMGFFVRGDLGLRFNEQMDVGEDFDFYLRLPSFVKLPRPLVNIGYSLPSAGGPRGYEDTDWLGACNAVIRSYAQGAT